jgi:hypothetical protein
LRGKHDLLSRFQVAAVGLMVLALIGTSAIFVVAQDTESSTSTVVEPTAGPAEEAPDPNTDKVAGALEDMKQEQARIQAAASTFEASREFDSVDGYLVSLSQPIPLSKLLGDETREVDAVFTWMLEDNSLYPKTGYWQMSSFPKDMTTEEVTSRIEQETIGYLEDRIQEIAALHESGDLSDESAQEQIAEAKNLSNQVSTEGIQIYGFTCSCAPSYVLALGSTIDGLSIRTAESMKETGWNEPIWPINPYRESVLGSDSRPG